MDIEYFKKYTVTNVVSIKLSSSPNVSGNRLLWCGCSASVPSSPRLRKPLRYILPKLRNTCLVQLCYFWCLQAIQSYEETWIHCMLWQCNVNNDWYENQERFKWNMFYEICTRLRFPTFCLWSYYPISWIHMVYLPILCMGMLHWRVCFSSSGVSIKDIEETESTRPHQNTANYETCIYF